MTSLKSRKKKVEVEQTSVKDLLLALGKAIGIHLNENYDPNSFAQFWVDIYQSEDPESYEAQGAYLSSLLTKLYDALEETETITIVPTNRKTRVWNTGNLRVQYLTDSEIVDEILYAGEILTKTILEDSTPEINLLVMNYTDD